MAAQWKCEYPTPHTLFFSFLHVPHFSKKYSRGVEPLECAPAGSGKETSKRTKTVTCWRPHVTIFVPPLNISEKKDNLFIIFVCIGLHLQKMFQFVEFVVHVIRFGGRNHDFCRYSQILETSEEYFCSTPPPPHPITKKLGNLCCSSMLLNFTYCRLKNTTFEENVETSHIFEKKKKYTAFSLKCAHFIIFIFVYKTKHWSCGKL